jgi:hypothetical protein
VLVLDLGDLAAQLAVEVALAGLAGAGALGLPSLGVDLGVSIRRSCSRSSTSRRSARSRSSRSPRSSARASSAARSAAARALSAAWRRSRNHAPSAREPARHGGSQPPQCLAGLARQGSLPDLGLYEQRDERRHEHGDGSRGQPPRCAPPTRSTTPLDPPLDSIRRWMNAYSPSA